MLARSFQSNNLIWRMWISNGLTASIQALLRVWLWLNRAIVKYEFCHDTTLLILQTFFQMLAIVPIIPSILFCDSSYYQILCARENTAHTNEHSLKQWYSIVTPSKRVQPEWTHLRIGTTVHTANSREIKKLRRQLQGKSQIKIDYSTLITLCKIGGEPFRLLGTNEKTWKGKEWKIYCCELPLSSEPQIWKFRVVVWQTTSKHCTKKRATPTARLFFLIQPIKSLICSVVVDVAVIFS